VLTALALFVYTMISFHHNVFLGRHTFSYSYFPFAFVGPLLG